MERSEKFMVSKTRTLMKGQNNSIYRGHSLRCAQKRMLRVLNEVPGSKKNHSLITNFRMMLEFSFNDLSVEELNKFVSTIEAEVIKMDLDIARSTQRLTNRMDRQGGNEIEIAAALENLEDAQETLQTLIDLGATAEQQANQIAIVAKMQANYDKEVSGVTTLTPHEIQLLVLDINLQNTIREQKVALMEEVNVIIEENK